jgi:hypothetical protein
MSIVLLVAIFTVHVSNGFSSIKLESVDAAGAHFGQPGYETDLLYLAALVAMVLGGSGPLALDRLLFRRFAVTEPSNFGFPNGRRSRPSDAEPARSETQQAGSLRSLTCRSNRSPPTPRPVGST